MKRNTVIIEINIKTNEIIQKGKNSKGKQWDMYLGKLVKFTTNTNKNWNRVLCIEFIDEVHKSNMKKRVIFEKWFDNLKEK